MNNSTPPQPSICPYVDTLTNKHPSLLACKPEIAASIKLLINAFSNNRKLLVCGNGGSAADSEHIVGELMKSFTVKRPVDENFALSYQEINGEPHPSWLEGALPAISLASQSSLTTAFINDANPVGLFAQQVYGYGDNGDILLALSTSGNSQNVVEAAKVARAKKMHVIAMTGRNKAELDALSEVCIKVPETKTYKIQELHLPIYHAICAEVERTLFCKDEGFNLD